MNRWPVNISKNQTNEMIGSEKIRDRQMDKAIDRQTGKPGDESRQRGR